MCLYAPRIDLIKTQKGHGYKREIIRSVPVGCWWMNRRGDRIEVFGCVKLGYNKNVMYV